MVLAPNPLGVAALVAGIVLVAFGLVQQLLTIFVLPRIAVESGRGYGTISDLVSVLAFVALTLAVVATILGMIAVTRPGVRKGSAAAGLAVGVAGVLSSLISIAVPFVVYTLY